MVFDFTHPGNFSNHQQNHPNRYFDQSMRYYKEKEEFEKQGKVGNTPRPHVPTNTVVVNK
jgi:hypothetical protein